MDKVEIRSVIKYLYMKCKTWVYLYDPEMKYQSMEWKLPKEPSPKKVKASRHSAVKVMLTVFWDAEGIILADFLPASTNIKK